MARTSLPDTLRRVGRIRRRLVRLLPRRLTWRLPIPYGDDPRQRVQLFLPSSRGFPVVVCVYGSFWHSRGAAAWRPVGAMLRSHGFGAAVIGHRLWPPDRWPAQLEDVAAALAWTRAHIAEFGGDASRIALLGHSSGGQLALLTALDRGILGSHGLAPDAVRAVVALGAPTDLVPRADGSGFGNVLLDGRGAEVFGRDLAVMHAASPDAHVAAGLPPIQLVVGDRDLPMLADDMERFRASCEAAGNQVGIVRAPGRDHMGLVPALLQDGDVNREVVRFLEGALRPCRN